MNPALGVKVQLFHIIAPTVPMWAVFADEQGNPRFEPVVALGTMEYSKGQPDEPGYVYKRLVSGFSVNDHIESCDWKPEFVGYSTVDPETMSPDGWLAYWTDRTKAKREAIEKAKAEAEANKGKPQIIVPGQDVVNPFQ